MRFHFGAIPNEFTPDDSWRPIREPGPLMMQLIALPIGVGVALAIGFCWLSIGGPMSVGFASGQADMFLTALVLSFPLLIVVHEFLHAVVHPRCGRSRATIIGAWPARLLFYAHYSGPMSRERFLAVFAMPFLVITILPLIVAALWALSPPLLFWATWFSIWNAFFACGDILGFVLILFQVPSRASVQNQSWNTYWQSANSGPQ